MTYYSEGNDSNKQTNKSPRKVSIFIVILMLMNITMFAQTKDEKDVASRVEALRTAMLNGDEQSLNELTSKNLTYGHSNALIEDKATFIQSIVSKKFVFTSIDLSNQTVTVVDKTAIVRHRLIGNTFDNNIPGKADITILLVWQKEKSSWKLLARQATKTPQ